MGGISAYNAVSDAYKGKDFDWNNARGMLGLAALGGNYAGNKQRKTFNSKVTSKNVPSSTESTLTVRVGKANDAIEVEIPVHKNMSDSDIEFKAKQKLE
jgi:hypothetical protein